MLADPRTRRAGNDLAMSSLLKRLAYILDTAGDVSRASLRNWRNWKGSEQLHAIALQEDLDIIVSILAAVLRGDDDAFETPEFEEWRRRRSPA